MCCGLGTVLSLYHMTYDIVLLTASVAALATLGAPRRGSRWTTGVLALLFLVPCLNWVLDGVRAGGRRPPHGLWIGIASVNGAVCSSCSRAMSEWHGRRRLLAADRSRPMRLLRVCPAPARQRHHLILDNAGPWARALWLQLRIVNFEAAEIATTAGLDVVMDRCLKMEHGRFNGTLHWGGMNTEIISARKAVVGRR